MYAQLTWFSQTNELSVEAQVVTLPRVGRGQGQVHAYDQLEALSFESMICHEGATKESAYLNEDGLGHLSATNAGNKNTYSATQQLN